MFLCNARESLHKAVLLPQCLPQAGADDAPGTPGTSLPASLWQGCHTVQCHLQSMLKKGMAASEL